MKRLKTSLRIGSALALLLAGVAGAEDARQLEGMSVIGNQELPRALFIVPWKRTELGASVPAPTSGVVNEGLAPLDPEVFQRELHNREALQQAN